MGLMALAGFSGLGVGDTRAGASSVDGAAEASGAGATGAKVFVESAPPRAGAGEISLPGATLPAAAETGVAVGAMGEAAVTGCGAGVEDAAVPPAL